MAACRDIARQDDPPHADEGGELGRRVGAATEIDQGLPGRRLGGLHTRARAAPERGVELLELVDGHV